MTFTCSIDRLLSITMINVNKSSQSLYSSGALDLFVTSVEIPNVNAVLDIDLDSKIAALTFRNVSCDLEGEYSITLNGDSGVESTVQLNIQSKHLHITGISK